MIWILGWMLCLAMTLAEPLESFNTNPPPIRSGFSCSGRRMGYYADLETNCRAYHTCDDHGNHFTHYCPEDTAFRQDAMICDHAYLVDCHAVAERGATLRLGQDASHQAPPSSFVEHRGEGSQGFARSFRINPESKNDTTSSKYPTFVLNSSVFLINRETTSRRPVTSYRESNDESARFKVTPQNQKDFDLPTAFRSNENPSRNSIVTTSRPSISEHLQPPTESSRAPKVVNDLQDDEYSFLIPPPVRDDNNYFIEQSNFESLKSDSTQRGSHSTFRIVTADLTTKDSRGSTAFTTRAPTTFTTRVPTSFTTRVPTNFITRTSTSFTSRAPTTPEPSKLRVLDSNFAKPVNYLEPPHLKPDFQTYSHTNFRLNDTPYKETFRSIQNNFRSDQTSSPSGFTTSTTANPTAQQRSSGASIFAVPTKALAPGGDSESDPYYPKPPATTEAYYTPRQQQVSRRPGFFASAPTTHRPFNSNVKLEIPAVLPDLNSLEDLLDRRKFFFIPQTKSV